MRTNRVISKSTKTFVLLSFGLAMISCSSGKYLSKGEYKLARNNFELTAPAEGINISDLSKYVKQQPATFNLGKNIPTVFNPELIDASIGSIADHMEYMGYFNSSISANVDTTKKRKAKLLFTINPGNTYTISSINFNLPDNENIIEDFYADTLNATVKKGDILSEASLVAESERMAKYLRNKGYFGVTKNNFSFEADTLSHDGNAILSMTLSGAQPLNKFYISKVSISRPANLNFRDDILKDLNLIKPGSLYNEEAINKTYTRLAALKIFNSVGVELSPVSETLVNCDINLTQSQIHGFKISLEASTNSAGLLGFSPELNYTNKNIFGGGEWFSIGLSGNHQFKINEDISSDEFAVATSLSIPRFLGLPLTSFSGANIPRTEINLSYNYQDRPEYNRTQISTSFGYTGATRHNINYQLYPIRINLVKLMHIDESFSKTLENNPYIADAYRTHIDAGIGGTIYYATNTDIIPKTTYSYVRFSTDLSGNLISLFTKDLLFGLPYSQYIRGELTLGHTWRFGNKNNQAIATRFLAGAGLAYGASSVLPFERQFYVGGANSLRGWQARTVGPGDVKLNEAFVIPSQTGELKFEANAEYRFGLFWKMEGAAFIDAGNVWALKDRTYSEEENPMFSFSSIAADWGIGIRCNLDFLVIRVDTGFRIHDPARAEGQRWLNPGQWFKRNGYAIHFGVGYPF